MRLTTFILIVFSLHISATVYSQRTKLSLEIKNQSIKEVLYQIESQSEFRFIYESGKVNLDKKVSLQMKEQTVETILENLFKNETIKYEITENNLILINPSGNINLSSTPVSLQQKKTITGRVLDERGEPVIGANVIEKGTTNGIVTDIDGQFSISITGNAILQVSYIGYIAQEISIRNQNNIRITMREDLQTLNEVVVVGYGTMAKKNLTTSIAKVDPENISKVGITNATQMLMGRAAGLQATINSSQPGGSCQFEYSRWRNSYICDRRYCH